MNIIISNTSEKPIYEQITTQIKAIIMKGELNAGDALPSIRFLAKELRISVITTKRAYEELERDGFIETVPGKGSFVASGNQELLREDHRRSSDSGYRKRPQLFPLVSSASGNAGRSLRRITAAQTRGTKYEYL